ncbi:MAG: molybdopterin-dependent oxidoreductase [Terracidiphilus sp.]|nr:molybdopterin-dependent oxidoreductase [Terracidiphilus sp.]
MNRPPRNKTKVFGPEYMSHRLQVEGLVLKPLSLTVDDLRQFPLSEPVDLALICGSGRNDGVQSGYRGVRLTDLIEHADPIMRYHDSPNYMFVTLISTDLHWALFSFQELFNSTVGECAIIAIEKGGRPLDEKEGEIAFFSANDKAPGPRRLRYLKRIVLHEHTLSAEESA